jgi:hypothetical protein
MGNKIGQKKGQSPGLVICHLPWTTLLKIIWWSSGAAIRIAPENFGVPAQKGMPRSFWDWPAGFSRKRKVFFPASLRLIQRFHYSAGM